MATSGPTVDKKDDELVAAAANVNVSNVGEAPPTFTPGLDGKKAAGAASSNNASASAAAGPTGKKKDRCNIL